MVDCEALRLMQQASLSHMVPCAVEQEAAGHDPLPTSFGKDSAVSVSSQQMKIGGSTGNLLPHSASNQSATWCTWMCTHNNICCTSFKSCRQQKHKWHKQTSLASVTSSVTCTHRKSATLHQWCGGVAKLCSMPQPGRPLTRGSRLVTCMPYVVDMLVTLGRCVRRSLLTTGAA